MLTSPATSKSWAHSPAQINAGSGKRKVKIQRCVLTYEGPCRRHGDQILPQDCHFVGMQWEPDEVEVAAFYSPAYCVRGESWEAETREWVHQQLLDITFASFRVVVRDSKASGDMNAYQYAVCGSRLAYLGMTAAPRLPGERERAPADADPGDGMLSRPQSPRDGPHTCVVPVYSMILQFSQTRTQEADFRFYFEDVSVICNERMRFPLTLNADNMKTLQSIAGIASRQCVSACTVVLTEFATVDGLPRVHTLTPFSSADTEKQMAA
jgi:hypothetical protein